MDRDWLSILRCPRTRQPLRPARPGEVAAARARGVTLDEALATSDGTLAYPVAGGILCLLPGSAIALGGGTKPDNASNDGNSAGSDGNGSGNGNAHAAQTKDAVESFYDRVGWQADEEGNFEDATRWEDLRDVARQYIHDCHLRVNRHLRRPGRYLLDVASGPLQYDEYLTYGEGFERRICVDLSRVALAAARRRLGERGLYVQGDITNLPFADDSVDAVVSLHTIYHVPVEQQGNAFGELGRVLKPGRSGVVVYSWGFHSLLPRTLKLASLPLRLGLKLAARLRGGGEAGELYFSPQSQAWFESQAWPFRHRILVWRTPSVAMLRAFVHGAPGRLALHALHAAEERWPGLFGRVGQYPLIVIDKPDVA